MSSNTPTGSNKSFEESVEEGLKDTDLTPEEFDREELQRRQRMARAFQHLADDAPEVSVGDAETTSSTVKTSTDDDA